MAPDVLQQVQARCALPGSVSSCRPLPCNFAVIVASQEHVDAADENRLALRLVLADEHCQHAFVVYHDQLLASFGELGFALP